jgi:hypothetical protein
VPRRNGPPPSGALPPGRCGRRTKGDLTAADEEAAHRRSRRVRGSTRRVHCRPIQEGAVELHGVGVLVLMFRKLNRDLLIRIRCSINGGMSADSVLDERRRDDAHELRDDDERGRGLIIPRSGVRFSPYC